MRHQAQRRCGYRNRFLTHFRAPLAAGLLIAGCTGQLDVGDSEDPIEAADLPDVQRPAIFGLGTFELPGTRDYEPSKAPGDVLWAQQIGGPASDKAYDVQLGSFGEILTTGTFWGEVDFGGEQRTASEGYHFFAAAYTAQGENLWVAASQGIGNHIGRAIAIDGHGETVIVGSFTGHLKLGELETTSKGGTDVFIVRFDRERRPLWTRRLGGIGNEVAQAVAIDADGRIVVAGHFDLELQAGSYGLKTRGDVDVFVMEMTREGEVSYAFSSGSAKNDTLGGLAVYPTGAYAVAINFRDQIKVGDELLLADGQDICVSAYLPRGHHVWTRKVGGTGTVEATALAFGPSGNIFVAGAFTGSIDFGRASVTSNGGNDAFLAVMSSRGQGFWMRGFGGPGTDRISGIAIDPTRGAVVTGTYESALGNTDVTVAGTDVAGTITWYTSLGSIGDEVSAAVAIDHDGNALATGSFESEMKAGEFTLDSAGNSDIYLVSLAQ